MNKRLNGLAASFTFAWAGFVGAEPCDCAGMLERIQLLEQRIQVLEARMGQARPSISMQNSKPGYAEALPLGSPQETAKTSTPAIPQAHPTAGTPVTQAGPVATPETIDRGTAPGMAQARFYLLRDAGSLQPEQAPDAAGLVPFQGEVSFKPGNYGLGAGGLFSEFDDPSLYPASALTLVGRLQVEVAGEYRLIAHPKPAREGGSSVRTSLVFSLSIDGKVAIPETRTQGWRRIEQAVTLSAGAHRVEIRALAQSPGFGPSPTASRLLFEVRGPRDAAARPLTLSEP